jgi:hypothetical protein
MRLGRSTPPRSPRGRAGREIEPFDAEAAEDAADQVSVAA